VGVGAGLCMYDVVVKKFTFAISSPDEFLVLVPRLVTKHLKDFIIAVRLSYDYW